MPTMDLRRPLPLVIALALGGGVLTGCGGGVGVQEPRELSASDSSQVLGAVRTISRACAGDQASVRGIPDAVSVIIRETEENPNRIYEVGSGERALVMYEYATNIAGTLQRCNVGGDSQAILEASAKAKASI